MTLVSILLTFVFYIVFVVGTMNDERRRTYDNIYGLPPLSKTPGLCLRLWIMIFRCCVVFDCPPTPRK